MNRQQVRNLAVYKALMEIPAAERGISGDQLAKELQAVAKAGVSIEETDALVFAFPWSASPQGPDFWAELSNKHEGYRNA